MICLYVKFENLWHKFRYISEVFITICRSDHFWKRRCLTEFSLINENDYQKYIPGVQQYLSVRSKFSCFPGMEIYQHINKCLKMAVKINDTVMVDYLIEQGANTYNKAIYTATRYKHMNLLYFLLDKSPTYNESILSVINGAAVSQNFPLFIDFISRLDKTETINMTDTLYYACKGGSIEILEYIINMVGSMLSDVIVTNYESGLFGAIRGGHLKIINIYTNSLLNLVDINMAALLCIKPNHYRIFEYMLIKGADNYESFLFEAAKYNRADMILLINHHSGKNMYAPIYLGLIEKGNFQDFIDVLPPLDISKEWPYFLPFIYPKIIDRIETLLDEPFESIMTQAGFYYSLGTNNIELYEYFLNRGAIIYPQYFQKILSMGRCDLLMNLISLSLKYPNSIAPEFNLFQYHQAINRIPGKVFEKFSRELAPIWSLLSKRKIM